MNAVVVIDGDAVRMYSNVHSDGCDEYDVISIEWRKDLTGLKQLVFT